MNWLTGYESCTSSIDWVDNKREKKEKGDLIENKGERERNGG